MNALGTPGNAKRRFFYGPGADNYDMAVTKNLRITEANSLSFAWRPSTSSITPSSSDPAPWTAISAAQPSARQSAPPLHESCREHSSSTFDINILRDPRNEKKVRELLSEMVRLLIAY